MDQLIHHPQTISFPPALGLISTTTLPLHNITNSNLSYHLSTPQHSPYTAHPTSGHIPPNQRVAITLTHHAELALATFSSSSHRFVLTVTTPLSSQRAVILVTGIFAHLSTHHHALALPQNGRSPLALPPDRVTFPVSTPNRPTHDVKNIPQNQGSAVTIPEAITFHVTPNAPSRATLPLRNPTDSPSAYKIFTNRVSRYGVQPNVGILHPHSDASVRIVRHAVPAVDSHDLFIVQLADLRNVPPGVGGEYHGYADVMQLCESVSKNDVTSTTVRVLLKHA